MSAAQKAGRRLIWGAAAVLGAGMFTGISVAAADTGPTEQPTTTQSEQRQGNGPGNGYGRGQGQGNGHRGDMQQRSLHSETVMQGEDGPVTVLKQSGEVTAVDGDSITVRSTDGFTQTWSLGDELTVMKDGEEAAIGDVKVGEQVRVVGVETGDGAEARHIGVHSEGFEPGQQNGDRDRDRQGGQMMEDLLEG